MSDLSTLAASLCIMDYKGKVVLVTGAAGEIGKNFCQAFLEKGSKVCMCDLNEKNLLTLEEEFSKKFGKENILACKCDVTKDEDFEASFDKCEKVLGNTDIVINNAGIISGRNFKFNCEVNFEGAVRGSELALKRMGKNKGGKGGHIVNTGSIAGVAVTYLDPFYSATKAGLIHYTRAVGHEFHYNYTGVVVQCICPIVVDTALVPNSEKDCYNNLTTEFRRQISLLPVIPVRDVTNALFKLIEEKKLGAVMVVSTNKETMYIDPPIPNLM